MKRRKDEITPEARTNTLAIADVDFKLNRSKVAVPTEEGVAEAKAWVEETEK